MTEVERIVSRAKRGRAVFVGAIGFICIAVTFAIVDIGQESRITNIERSACVKDPAGEACQRSKRQSDRQRSLADTCIAFWKAGYPCPKPGSKASRRVVEPALAGEGRPQSASAPPLGDSDSDPTPANPASGGDVAPGKGEPGGLGGGHESPPKPPQSSPGAESGGQASGPSVAPETAPSSTQPKQPLREGVQSVLEDAGSTIKGTGEAATALPCGLQARLLGTC
jgi:hypothetical protein